MIGRSNYSPHSIKVGILEDFFLPMDMGSAAATLARPVITSVMDKSKRPREPILENRDHKSIRGGMMECDGVGKL